MKVSLPFLPEVSQLLKRGCQATSFKVANKCFQEALAMDPKNPALLTFVAYQYITLSQYRHAKQLLSDVFSYECSAVSLGYFGLCEFMLNRHLSAVPYFERSLKLDNRNPLILAAYGSCLTDLKIYKKAKKCFKNALLINPRYPGAHFNLGILLLTIGDYKNAWPEYQWREASFAIPSYLSSKTQRWSGQSLTGKRCLLLCEQGAGDNIQFVRYAKDMFNMGARLTLFAPSALASLLESTGWFENIVTTHSDAAYSADGDFFDYYAFIASIPHYLDPTLLSVSSSIPYLSAPIQNVKKMSALIENTNTLKVGIVWRGNPTYPKDSIRSASLNDVIPLFKIKGLSIYSLQLQSPSSPLEPIPNEVIDLSSHLSNFSDTAAAISLLDLIICVDTSVLHLAGALGKEVWALVAYMSDWRWGPSGTTSVWYPTIKIFRQQAPGEWSKVISDVVAAIRHRLSDVRPK